MDQCKELSYLTSLVESGGLSLDPLPPCFSSPFPLLQKQIVSASEKQVIFVKLLLWF